MGSTYGEENSDECVSSKTRIPEDTLLYAIYPDWTLQYARPHTQINLPEAESALKELQVYCLDTVSPLLQDYIWQHQSFNLETTVTTRDSNSSHAVIPHLHGKLKYGDNVEDEWFAVYLLYELSRKLPNISAQAWDSDGEFLLIEAAYAIPRWLKPENSRNRVFIRRGALHILPLPNSPSEIYQVPLKPSVWDSLRILTGSTVETQGSSPVQAAINSRLAGYPEKARKNMHRVRVRVPLAVAQVLRHEPHLISMAVEAFYDRDIDSMKAASTMETFLGDKEMVDISIFMSKAMYAQLVQQVFQAPRQYPMPPLSSPGYKEVELGMKITCGFEMMYWQRSQYRSEADDVEPELNQTSFNGVFAGNSKVAGVRSKDIGWEAFKKSLEQKGYFRGLLEGSKQYRRLMDDALDHYRNTSLFSRISTAMHAPVKRIDEILALPYSASDFVGLDLPPSDDEAWLYNGEEDLNTAMLERQKEIDSYEIERSKHKQAKDQKRNHCTLNENMNNFNPEVVAKNVQAFVDKMSSYEGAEVCTKGESERVSMDTRHFMKELKSAMGYDIKNKAVSYQEESLEETDTSCSDMDFDESESDSSPRTALSEKRQGAGRTNGNGGFNDTFMDDYTDVLQEELNNSTLKKSFVRAEVFSSSGDTNKAPTNSFKRTEDEELTPVDIDVNLVQSLLDSFSSQEGLPGPASNLLGLMGLQLPDDAKKRKHDS